MGIGPSASQRDVTFTMTPPLVLKQIGTKTTLATIPVSIQNLSAGRSYLASVTPYNKKGFGQTSHVMLDTLSHPAIHKVVSHSNSLDPEDLDPPLKRIVSMTTGVFLPFDKREGLPDLKKDKFCSGSSSTTS